MAVSDIMDHDNTIIYSKRYGDWIVNDQTGAATQLYFESGTSNLDAWFLPGSRKQRPPHCQRRKTQGFSKHFRNRGTRGANGQRTSTTATR